MKPINPIDAATRGRLRQFKAELATRYARLDRLIDTHGMDADMHAFANRSSATGRGRAFERVRRALATTGATLEGVRLTGKWPLAVWSILKPRDAVVRSDDPSDAQNCVTVNYILVGRFPNRLGNFAEGIWTLELPDHALGRLIQRQTEADPVADIRAAHHAAFRLRQNDVAPDGWFKRDFHFLLPAGPGAFVCFVVKGYYKSPNDDLSVHIRARTWLHTDQLRDDQTPVLDDGAPGERLGDGWLLPEYLRSITLKDDGNDEGRLILDPWAPGLPEIMAHARLQIADTLEDLPPPAD